jgi:hypothetical protein
LQARLAHLEAVITGKLPHPANQKASDDVSNPTLLSESNTHRVPQSHRERCLILSNIPEPVEEDSEKRMEREGQFLQSLISKLFDNGEEGVTILSAFRLGKKLENDSSCRPRPLKIVLASEEQAKRILRRGYRLKGEELWIRKDLCPEDRVKLREAVQERKRRTEAGETHLRIVDFRVIKVVPRSIWKPISISPEVPGITDQ